VGREGGGLYRGAHGSSPPPLSPNTFNYFNLFSPRCGDERIMRFCVMEETPGMGGIKSILEATPGYFKFHLFDRGYKRFQVFFKVVRFLQN